MRTAYGVLNARGIQGLPRFTHHTICAKTDSLMHLLLFEWLHNDLAANQTLPWKPSFFLCLILLVLYLLHFYHLSMLPSKLILEGFHLTKTEWCGTGCKREMDLSCLSLCPQDLGATRFSLQSVWIPQILTKMKAIGESFLYLVRTIVKNRLLCCFCLMPSYVLDTRPSMFQILSKVKLFWNP